MQDNYRAKANEIANVIWSVADSLRGLYKQADYGKVILPMTVLRRLDSVLTPTKQKVLEFLPKTEAMPDNAKDATLNKIAGFNFHNRSRFDFAKLAEKPNDVAANLRNYINGFSVSAREILEYFDFETHIQKLDDPKTGADLLYTIIKKFNAIDLGEANALTMGYAFEELIRKFAELSNETAGEHFTPREVIRLMVDLLFIHDRDILTTKGIVKTLYDPACGTGGMLSVAEEYLQELNPEARLELFGQEINPESYAICKSDMLIKGQNPSNIKFGNTFTSDGLQDNRFDYMLSNPPFGVEWRNAEKIIKKEYETRGMDGRFGAGLPRINDGSFLFLQHMMSKRKRDTEGSRLAIVFNGSPLFTGSAGSGESDIRKWIIENDWLEAIVAMPDQLFYNTGISTYIFIVTNRKPDNRKGKVQLINATGGAFADQNNPFYTKMQRSLGNKRKEMSPQQIKHIAKLYGEYDKADPQFSKIFDNEFFGYNRITVERPLRDPQNVVIVDKKGTPKADGALRDAENVPLSMDIMDYFKREVIPHVPDAWVDDTKTKTGYEINFTKYFYTFKPLRPLEAIRKDILAVEAATEGLLKEII